MGLDQNKVIIDTIQASVSSIEVNLNNKDFINKIADGAELLNQTSNRIITTGMGKSGIIARKVAATLTSTGSPAVFLHPADALHGDMGNIQKKEVVLAFSNSGETREIIELLPHIQLLGAKLVAVTQGKDSTLDKEADISIVFDLTREGCPLNLAPMASTTVSLIVGDCISSALIQIKGFEPKDFSRFHPSGSLGKKLLTKIQDIMHSHVDKFTVKRETTFKEVISIMVSSNLGAVLIEGSKGHLRGIITDGDIKRLFELYESNIEELFNRKAEDIMKSEPVSIDEGASPEKAAGIMHEYGTYTLPVVNSQKKPVGLIRMHDVIGFT